MKRISLFVTSIACFFMLCLPMNSLAIEPIEPPIPPIGPIVIPPILIPDFILSYDATQATSSQTISDSDSHIRTYALPLTFNDEDVGFLKVEYNRINTKYTNGTEAISFVTAKDTFYLNDLIFYGQRRNKEIGVYDGKGVVQEIILESNNQVVDVNMSYYFNHSQKNIRFYIQD